MYAQLPKFTASVPDPFYAIGPGGRDNPVSKQVRALEAAGYTSDAIREFVLYTEPCDYAARQIQASAMRLRIHMAADRIGSIKGCSFDPDHVFCLALKSKLTEPQVRAEIIQIMAQHDEDTHTDTTRRIDNHSRNSEIYAARAAQVASHGRK